jgi:hypothetical protein
VILNGTATLFFNLPKPQNLILKVTTNQTNNLTEDLNMLNYAIIVDQHETARRRASSSNALAALQVCSSCTSTMGRFIWTRNSLQPLIVLMPIAECTSSLEPSRRAIFCSM